MEKVFDLIKQITGLNFNEAHKVTVSSYIEGRMKSLNLNVDDFITYLNDNPLELSHLIDEAAINETYFFREQNQFDFLEKIYIPQNLKSKLTVWSAACSSGEEAISLYSLFKRHNIEAEVFASDIDMSAMKIFKNGLYKKNSFRSDGSSFKEYLKLAGKFKNDIFQLDDESRKNITVLPYNLNSSGELPFPEKSLDIIFLRNVFIYFEDKLRITVLNRISRLLKKDGIIVLSTNEIPLIKTDKLTELVKENKGSIWYLKKAGAENKTFDTVDSIIFREENEYEEYKKEFLSRLKSTKKTNSEKKSSLKTDKNMEEKLRPVTDKISVNQLEEAQKILDSIEFRPENEEYHFFLQGKIDEGNMDLDKALSSFEKSVYYNKDFWPSLFEKGIILKEKGQTRYMAETFFKCGERVADYISKEMDCYSFLTESFSPSYFLNLCYKYIFN